MAKKFLHVFLSAAAFPPQKRKSESDITGRFIRRTGSSPAPKVKKLSFDLAAPSLYKNKVFVHLFQKGRLSLHPIHVLVGWMTLAFTSRHPAFAKARFSSTFFKRWRVSSGQRLLVDTSRLCSPEKLVSRCVTRSRTAFSFPSLEKKGATHSCSSPSSIGIAPYFFSKQSAAFAIKWQISLLHERSSNSAMYDSFRNRVDDIRTCNFFSCGISILLSFNAPLL